MKARTRLLASFLALLLCLSPVTVWASPEAPRPSHVVDLALSDTAESQLPLREAVAPLGYRQDDWVTVMVELEEEPLPYYGGETEGKAVVSPSWSRIVSAGNH